jgi:hypothetical protein
MLYYRTHASRRSELPPELVGWESPSVDASLNEQTIGEHRVLAITPQFVFDAPMTGWETLCPGWEVANKGPFSSIAHVNKRSQFFCSVVKIGDEDWLIPSVLTDNGVRNFQVIYGGDDFLPRMTEKQTRALALATEVRTALLSDNLPDFSIRAKWAAEFLTLTYCLSVKSISIVGISEQLIDQTLKIAGGCHAPGG